ncbi:MAG TPA: 4Fe-4S binding protein [Spirochaetia bacterium]|nr:4Fe-4S binding protein [Spirochaetia bacterium]
MLAVDGVAEAADVAARIPPPERLAAGPVVMAECFQAIPCDPCYHACPQKAFLPFEDLNSLPRVDYARCNGCGVCVTRCPGLALFIVDCSDPAGEALITLPYEFLPLPAAGETVTGVDRAGQAVCAARVVKVVPGGPRSKTSLIRLAVPKDYAMTVRHWRRF